MKNISLNNSLEHSRAFIVKHLKVTGVLWVILNVKLINKEKLTYHSKLGSKLNTSFSTFAPCNALFRQTITFCAKFPGT